jgi:glycosyltransferase involved in cell wall biosynthesis
MGEISVIITNYNYGKYLSRAIRSVINQSLERKKYEIIVVDDCSIDDSRKVIENFYEHIKPIFNDKNLGLASSCNVGIKQAVGKYMIRVDADDYVCRDCLKTHHLFLENNKTEMDASSSDYFEVDEQENVIRRRSGVTFPIAAGVMYRTDDVFKLGFFDPSLPREDEDFRKRFLNSGRYIYNIPIPLYRYFQHKESMSKEF